MLQVLNNRHLKTMMHKEMRDVDPYDLYADMYYGPSGQDKSRAFAMAFPNAKGEYTTKTFITTFHSMTITQKALVNAAKRRAENISPDTLIMKLHKIIEDDNEQTKDVIKAIEVSAKLRKYFTDEVTNNFHKTEIVLVVPEFDVGTPEISYDDDNVIEIDMGLEDGNSN